MSRKEVLQMIKDYPYATLGTVDSEGCPRLRPMLITPADDNFLLWSSTHIDSGKYKEMKNNPKVELLFWDKDTGTEIRVTAIADVSGKADKKSEIFKINPKIKNCFGKIDNPIFVHLEFKPTSVRYKYKGFCDYTEVL